jgi:hypothetical protein
MEEAASCKGSEATERPTQLRRLVGRSCSIGSATRFVRNIKVAKHPNTPTEWGMAICVSGVAGVYGSEVGATDAFPPARVPPVEGYRTRGAASGEHEACRARHLRHSFATHLLEDGHGVGPHRSARAREVSTTMVYRMCSIVVRSACAVLSTGADVTERGRPRTVASNQGRRPFGATSEIVDSRGSRSSQGGDPMSVISRERSRPMRPFAANHVSFRGGRSVLAFAHARTSGRSTSVRASRMDASGVTGLLHK